MSEDEKKNNLKELMAFFSTKERPLSPAEFKGFWNSLTDQEKEYYYKADLG